VKVTAVQDLRDVAALTGKAFYLKGKEKIPCPLGLLWLRAKLSEKRQSGKENFSLWFRGLMSLS